MPVADRAKHMPARQFTKGFFGRQLSAGMTFARFQQDLDRMDNRFGPLLGLNASVKVAAPARSWPYPNKKQDDSIIVLYKQY
jgi:hypothetical protein